jgi:hypothetical protein
MTPTLIYDDAVVEVVLVPPTEDGSIIQSPMCSCKYGEQSVEHILCDCKLHEHETETLKPAMIRSESWPVSKDILGTKYYKNFKEFTDNILLNKE